MISTQNYDEPKKGNIIVYGNYIVNNGDYTEIHHVDHYYNYAKEEAGGAAVPKGASLLLPAVADADAVEVDSHEEVGEVLRQVASALAPADPQGLTAQVFERIFLEPQSQPQRQQLQEYALASLRSNHRVTYRMGAAALAPLVRIIGRLHQL